MRGVLFGVMVLWVLTVPRPSWGAETGEPAAHKEAAVQIESNGAPTDQKKALSEATGETLENKSVAPSRGDEKRKDAETPEAAGHEKVEGALETRPQESVPSPKKVIPTPQEDRPWLIKRPPTKKSDTPKKEPVPLAWENDAQKSACENGLKKFKKTFEKARTYSIRGDPCATARHAKDFLDQEARLRSECPSGFLERSGYSEKIIQNLRVLLELGKKACLERE